MKIPGWSSLIIVPMVILGSSFNVIRRSESPVTLGLIVGFSAFIVALIAWGLLALLDRMKRR